MEITKDQLKAEVASSDLAWDALRDYAIQVAGHKADIAYWKEVASLRLDQVEAAEHEKAVLRLATQAAQAAQAAQAQRIDCLTASNAALRIEIERLGAPEHASNAEAAAWRWATGNETQTISVCELDGTEWIPVTSSQAGLAAVAAEIAKRNYGPQWTAGSVLARMALGAERGE